MGGSPHRPGRAGKRGLIVFSVSVTGALRRTRQRLGALRRTRGTERAARSTERAARSRAPCGPLWTRKALPTISQMRRRSSRSRMPKACVQTTSGTTSAARRLLSGRRQVPHAEGATGPADARPAEPSSSTAGRAPPRRFSAHWRTEEAAGVAAGIGGGASSVLGSEADFER